MDKSKLILSIAVVLASLILGSFYYAVQMKKQQFTVPNLIDEAEVIIKSDEFKENYLGECTDEEEGSLSKEYCECIYDYMVDNYTSKERLLIMVKTFAGKDHPFWEDAMKACIDKL